MITKEQALTASEFHFRLDCAVSGVRTNLPPSQPMRWRRNGMTKTWVRSPEKFRIPIKFGLYDYHYIDEKNAYQWHTIEECPKNAS
jgi:hypothetical protein